MTDIKTWNCKESCNVGELQTNIYAVIDFNEIE